MAFTNDSHFDTAASELIIRLREVLPRDCLVIGEEIIFLSTMPNGHVPTCLSPALGSGVHVVNTVTLDVQVACQVLRQGLFLRVTAIG